MLPSCALLELAGALGRVAADDSVTQQLAITGAAFSAAMTSAPGATLRAELYRCTGSVTVGSHVSGAAGAVSHLSGQVMLVQGTPLAGDCQHGRRAVRHRSILAALDLNSTLADMAAAAPVCTADVAHLPPDSTGFWMHPAAAEAAASLQAFVHRALPAGCRRCMRTAACTAYRNSSRGAAPLKLLRAVAVGQSDRRRRWVTSVSVQDGGGAAAAELMDLTSLLEGRSPVADSNASYTTTWQRVPEPAAVPFDRSAERSP